MTEAAKKPSGRWNGIDGVVVINLDSSTQRLENFMSRTGSRFPDGMVERISAVLGRELSGYGEPPWFTERTGERSRFWGGAAGCALSHRRAIEHARDKGWKNVLVFEDDACLTDSPEIWELVEKTLSTLEGGYLFYLGYHTPVPFGYKCVEGGTHDVWKVDGVLTTHAYLVSAAMYDLLLEYLPTEENVWNWLSVYKAVDVLYRDFLPMRKDVSVYVIYPVVCVQAEQFSEIAQQHSDNPAQTCNHPPRSIYSLKAIPRVWCPWLQFIKNKLNSIRTHRRALKGGLPGYRKPKN